MNIFKLPKWMVVMREIRDGDYIHKIGLKSDITYSHCFKIIYYLEKKGLIMKSSEGRRMIITLTVKGRSVQDDINKIVSVMGREDCGVVL